MQAIVRKIRISAFLAVLGMPIHMYGGEGGGICKRAGLMCSIWLDSKERKEYDGV